MGIDSAQSSMFAMHARRANARDLMKSIDLVCD